MSTKIYNSFKVELPLPQLHTALSTFSVKLRKEANDQFTDYIVREVVYFYDLWCCGMGSDKVNPAGAVSDDVTSRLRIVRTMGERDPAIDFSFSVTLFPITDAFLVKLNTEHDDFVQMFVTEIECEDFSYWTNSEAPDDVDNEEWERRRIQWDMIFRASPIPAHVGYTRELIRIDDFGPQIDAAIISSHLPTFKERCKRVALDMFVEHAEIKDFREFHRLLSDARNSGNLGKFTNKAESILVENIDPTLLLSTHQR